MSDRAVADPTVRVTDWPAKAAKIKKRFERICTVVLRIEAPGSVQCYCQVQRPRDGLLGGNYCPAFQWIQWTG